MSGAGRTARNAGIGTLVAMVLLLVPAAPAIGGGIAGYLERGSLAAGAIVGAVTGVFLASLLFPIALLVVPILVIAPLGVVWLPPDPLTFVYVLLAGVWLYTLPLAVVGGMAGVSIREAG